MRVLVTGAAGFIGSHILEAARGLGYEVRGFDSLTPAVHDGMPGYIPGDVDMIVADVRDAGAVSRALAGVDVVCHQAALVGLGVDLADLPGYCDVNVTGTATLLNAMGQAGVQRLVLASSMVVYGEGAYDCARHGRVRPAPRDREDLAPASSSRAARSAPTHCSPRPSPRTPRWTRATPTRRASSRRSTSPPRGPGSPAARPSPCATTTCTARGCRGTRRIPGVAAIFRSALEKGVAPRVFEDGRQQRDFVHVADVAAANLLALAATEDGPAGSARSFNVASGHPHTVGEMAAALAG